MNSQGGKLGACGETNAIVSLPFFLSHNERQFVEAVAIDERR